MRLCLPNGVWKLVPQIWDYITERSASVSLKFESRNLPVSYQNNAKLLVVYIVREDQIRIEVPKRPGLYIKNSIF